MGGGELSCRLLQRAVLVLEASTLTGKVGSGVSGAHRPTDGKEKEQNRRKKCTHAICTSGVLSSTHLYQSHIQLLRCPVTRYPCTQLPITHRRLFICITHASLLCTYMTPCIPTIAPPVFNCNPSSNNVIISSPFAHTPSWREMSLRSIENANHHALHVRSRAPFRVIIEGSWGVPWCPE